MLPNSQLYSSVAAAAIARSEGAGKQLCGFFDSQIKETTQEVRNLKHLNIETKVNLSLKAFSRRWEEGTQAIHGSERIHTL